MFLISGFFFRQTKLFPSGFSKWKHCAGQSRETLQRQSHNSAAVFTAALSRAAGDLPSAAGCPEVGTEGAHRAVFSLFADEFCFVLQTGSVGHGNELLWPALKPKPFS